jgi:ribosome maturation factor RimP
MTTRRKKIQEKARQAAGPVIAGMGLEIVDVEFLRRDGAQVLCFYLDRPGGITVDELQEASRSIENTLEVSEVVDGRYRLEVSSPGIDRPLRSREDFLKHKGARVKLKLFDPLPDGSQNLTAVIVAVEGDSLVFRRPANDADETVDIGNIARARPVIDWQALLKGSATDCAGSGPSGRSA